MARLITDEYRGVLQQMHAETSDWATSGAKFVLPVSVLVEHFRPDSVLDYGCGKGVLGNALRVKYPGIGVQMYDPAVKEYSQLPAAPVDLVVCTDVLEHIEPSMINDVLTHLEMLTQKAAYFVIHTGDCGFKLPDGRPAHLLQRPQEWWEAKLKNAFADFALEFNDTGLPLRFAVTAIRGQDGSV